MRCGDRRTIAVLIRDPASAAPLSAVVLTVPATRAGVIARAHSPHSKGDAMSHRAVTDLLCVTFGAACLLFFEIASASLVAWTPVPNFTMDGGTALYLGANDSMRYRYEGFTFTDPYAFSASNLVLQTCGTSGMRVRVSQGSTVDYGTTSAAVPDCPSGPNLSGGAYAVTYDFGQALSFDPNVPIYAEFVRTSDDSAFGSGYVGAGLNYPASNLTFCYDYFCGAGSWGETASTPTTYVFAFSFGESPSAPAITPPTLTTQMFIDIASLSSGGGSAGGGSTGGGVSGGGTSGGGSTGGVPSARTALGDAIQYYRNNVYSNLQAAIEDCIFNDNPPGCDESQLYMLQQQGYIKFAGDVTSVGVAIDSGLQGVAIGTAAVDTSTWDSTLLGKVVNFAELGNTIKTSLQNTLDFWKASSTGASSSVLGAAVASPLDPIVINSISGTMSWSENTGLNWLLSDLNVNVDIAKDYFPDLAVGQNFGSIDSLYPGSDAFGVFAVNDLVDPAGYNTVDLSLRQVDVFSNSVPEPATLALLGIGLAGIGFSRRRKRTS